jgi:hypothetical protein
MWVTSTYNDPVVDTVDPSRDARSVRRLIILLAICVPAVAGASILVSPTTATFPATQVGTTSSAMTFSVTEALRSVGDHTDTVTVSYSCADFTVTPTSGTVENDCENIGCETEDQTVPCIEPTAIECIPEETMTLSATFHPSVAAQESCAVTVTSSGGSLIPVSLTGTGTPPPIHVTASPASIAFGGVRTGTTSSTVNVTVTNSGGIAATISSVVASGTGYAIASGTSTSHTLAAGGSELHGVTCSPGATVGALANGALTITSNDPTNPTISIPLSCSGITSKVAASPSPIVIPTTRVGEPAMQTITLTNTGAATATIASVTVTGMTMVSAPPANTMLAENQSTTAVISFAATAAGSATGDLTVVTDTSTLDIPITADALVTSMSVTPDGEVDFGPVCSGQAKTQMFSLVANADGPFKLTAVSTPDAPFTVTTPTLPASVDGDGANTVTFSVTATPSDAGSAASSVQITTDIPNGTPDTIALTAIGLPTGVTATPAMVDLGNIAIDTTSLGQEIDLSNCSSSAITIADTMIYGSDADAFSIVQQPTSMMVAANSTVSWLVVMNAQTPGDVGATFEVDYTGGSATVALVGEPYDPNAGSGTDGGGSSGEKSSYYACSTGRGVALWPIAIALVALRRRRR